VYLKTGPFLHVGPSLLPPPQTATMETKAIWSPRPVSWQLMTWCLRPALGLEHTHWPMLIKVSSCKPAHGCALRHLLQLNPPVKISSHAWDFCPLIHSQLLHYRSCPQPPLPQLNFKINVLPKEAQKSLHTQKLVVLEHLPTLPTQSL
jgi:hypothetical protein